MSVHNKAAVDVEYEIPIKAAREVIVDDWLSSHPEVNPLLATKILQAPLLQ